MKLLVFTIYFLVLIASGEKHKQVFLWMFIIYNKVRSDSAIVVELLTTLKEDSEAKYDDLMKNGVYSIKVRIQIYFIYEVKQEYLASIIQTIDE